MSEQDAGTVFAVFNEIGILQQLSRALLEAHLPPGYLVSHFTVLNHLVRRGDGASPLQMANAFQTPKTTLTHTLAKLDADGLIAFRANPKDGRSKLVYLTDAGRAFREKAITDLGPDMVDVLTRIDAEDLAAILPTLTKLRTIMDAMRDEA